MSDIKEDIRKHSEKNSSFHGIQFPSSANREVQRLINKSIPPPQLNALLTALLPFPEHMTQAILCQVLENCLTFLGHCIRGLKLNALELYLQ